MDDTISFAMACKEEVAVAERSLEEQKALLSAFVKGGGSLRIGSKQEIELSTESSTIAKMLYMSFSQIYGAKCRFAYTRGIGFRKKTKYHVLVENPDLILEDLHVDFFSSTIPGTAHNEETKEAYLAGAFLSSGSVNDPSSSNYHLEVATSDLIYAKKLMHLINRLQTRPFSAKVASRRKEFIVYLKRSEEIADFIVLMKAPECCLRFEDVRLSRDYANIGNRLVNLDAANMSKTTAAAERQLKEIRYFEEHGFSIDVSPKLKALMALRVAHPDASLEELAALLSEELATTVTKSNINHLFRSLHAMYEEEMPS